MRDSLGSRLLRREVDDAPSRPLRFRSLYSDPSWIKDLDIVNELDGHSGCVNALSWSKSGRLLASGSDDQHLNIHTYHPEDSTAQFALTTTVATGHTANIFSVKFMPHSNDGTLVTAAGDSNIRIFDIEYSGASTQTSAASSLASQARRVVHNGVRYLTDGNTNCRVYRSHADRVKRIVTESSPHLFLTCSEDGEVRQWDLRQPSSAYPRGGSSVPPPLISYKRYNLDLNTISCSPSQPHYIALGGAHLHCFLHDRRMAGRDTLHERGASPSASNIMSDGDEELMGQATRCVKKFAPNCQQRMRRTDNGHITACKISDARPNEIIISWSGDHIYSFDMLRSPNAKDHQHSAQTLSHNTAPARVKGSSERKRKRRAGSQHSLSSPTHGVHSRQRTDESASASEVGEMALRVSYGNGQSEEIPIGNPADSTASDSTPSLSSLRERTLNEPQRRAYKVAKALVNLRQSMFTLNPPGEVSDADPTGYASLFQNLQRYARVMLHLMSDIMRMWRYTVDPTPEEVALQRTLRTNREMAYRFVQACGVVSRALSARPSELDEFNAIVHAVSPTETVLQREQFGYDFLKAIFLWLDSGVGALLEGFSCSSPMSRFASRLPVPKNSSTEALDELLIPYLLGLASDEPVVNVDASRFEVDENRVLYSSEKQAVMAFAAALKVPFADLSSTTLQPSLAMAAADAPSSTHVGSEQTQSRREALVHWGLRVARGILMNTGEGINFSFTDRAFGGMGQADSVIEQVEATELERHGDIDMEEDDPGVQSVRLVNMEQDGTPGSGLDEDTQTSTEDDAIALSELCDMFGASRQHREESESSASADVVVAMLEDEELSTDGDDDDDDAGDDSAEDVEDDDDDNEDGDVDDDHDNDDDDDEDDEDEDEDEDDEEAQFGLSRFMYRSAFAKRRLRELVEEDVPCSTHTRVFKGHCNVKTVKDVNFFGLQDEYVVSGSDDGNLFIWDRKTSQLVNILEGDGEVVNVVQGHPYEPMLAVSGIDNTIKVFSADSRAREAARLGRGVEAADSTHFSSISWPRQGRTSTSEPAVAAEGSAAEGQIMENEDYVAPKGLRSKRRMHLEYQIVSQNDVERQGGQQDAFITRSMLATLAQHIRRQRAGAGNRGGQGGEAGPRDTDVSADDCVVM